MSKFNMFNNVDVIDATKPLYVKVTIPHLERGTPCSFTDCAGVLAIKDGGAFDARVFRDTTYVQFERGGTVYRYKGDEAMRVVEILNDTKAIPQRVNDLCFTLQPPRPSQTLANIKAMAAKYKARRRAGKTRRYQLVKPVERQRPLDVLGVRPPAQRSMTW